MSKHKLFDQNGSVGTFFTKLSSLTRATHSLCQEQKPAETIPQFEHNKYGHIVFKITGIDYTGAQDIKRLSDRGHPIQKWAVQCLLSAKDDGYDKCHRLERGREYELAIVPSVEVEWKHIPHVLQQCAAFGYRQPLAGIIPRIPEIISDATMESMGFDYITALHQPITDSSDQPNILSLRYHEDRKQCLAADILLPHTLRREYGGLLFLTSAS
jgi:hypothetical protein